MRAEKIVAALLTADAGVAALVADRIYGGVAPEQAPAPLVIYSKRSAEHDPTLAPDGDGALVTAAIDVLCIAPTYPLLKALGEAVRQALAWQQGEIAGEQCAGITILGEDGDLYDPDLREHAQVWGFQVAHAEP